MSTTLSEADSKAALTPYGVPFADERVVATAAEAVDAAASFGGPVAVKLGGDDIAHKSERGLVKLGLADADSVATAAATLLAAARPDDGEVHLLVAPMISGNRELLAGAHLDPQFGPTVVVGIGGVLAEAIDDAVVRLAPITRLDAREMIGELRTADLLGPFRGEGPVDVERLCDVLESLSDAITGIDGVRSIDLNPLIVSDGVPVAVDALVEVER